MTQMSLELAQHYINHGLAGFYAYRAQAPIPHKKTMCVFADGSWWLIENGELQVEDLGIMIVPTSPLGWSRIHQVKVDENHPIVARLLADQARDSGPDFPIPVSLIIDSMPAAPIEQNEAGS